MSKRAKTPSTQSKSQKSPKKTSAGHSPQKPVPYTAANIEAVSQSLLGIVAEIDGHLASMKEAGIEELMIREGMLKRSMGHLGDFCDQLKSKIRKARGVEF